MQQPAATAAAAAAPQQVNMEEAWAAFRAGVTSVFKQVRVGLGGGRSGSIGDWMIGDGDGMGWDGMLTRHCTSQLIDGWRQQHTPLHHYPLTYTP